MKKYFVFTIFLLMLSSALSFAEDCSIPKWEDFCPKEYLEVKVLTRDEYCAKFPSLLPPMNSTIQEYNDIMQYWADRKVHFDKYLKTCEQLPQTARGVCYSKLEESQYAENKKWNNREKDRRTKEKDNTNRLKSNEMQRLNNQMRQFNPMY